METATLETIARQAENLPLEEQLILVEKLAQNLRRRVHGSQKSEREPQNLYGVWKNNFPADFNIDAALAEIRGDYKNEFEENS